MIVWGGEQLPGGTPLNTGARFNPVSASWTTVPSLNAPTPRSGHAAVWTGSEMFVWGGVLSGPDAGGRYDPSANQWRSMSTNGVPTSRRGLVAVWDGFEMVAWGGIDASDSVLSGASYNPFTDTWSSFISPSSIPSNLGRFHHSAIWTGREIILWAGRSSLQDGYLGAFLDWGTAYTPQRSLFLYLKQ
jgi:N-acetylneuraminic acid mutarotase